MTFDKVDENMLQDCLRKKEIKNLIRRIKRIYEGTEIIRMRLGNTESFITRKDPLNLFIVLKLKYFKTKILSFIFQYYCSLF